MITTLEISMYPLREHYVPAIDVLIELLEQRAATNDFKVEVFPTCTLVCGAFEVVFGAVQECIAAAQQQCGQAVYLLKVIPDYRGL